MRELTARIRFTSHCLGTAQDRQRPGRLLLPRTPAGHIMFLSTWHKHNMRLAADLLGRHQSEVAKILWDVAAVLVPAGSSCRWFRRDYFNSGQVARYAWHEAIFAGQAVELHCGVPETIPDQDFRQLLQLAGQYKGLSPYKPGEYGHFSVESVRRGC